MNKKLVKYNKDVKNSVIYGQFPIHNYRMHNICTKRFIYLIYTKII